MRHSLPSFRARAVTRRCTARAAALLCATLALPALTQIRTDGTVGTPATALAGPAYLIPQGLGKLSGANLFHSFQSFNIGDGESATFTTTTSGIANVISRVTGGGLSRIDGLLKLSAADGAPAFFFINPAGVTFGAGAAVDVPGAFHVGTADALVFRDGRFHADPAKASSFSAAPPEAFGFLGRQRAAVRFEPQSFQRDDLPALLPAAGFGVTAGDVLVDGTTLAVRGGGNLRVAAVGAEGVDVPLAGAFPALSGQVLVRNGSLLATVSRGGADGGVLQIGAGELALEGASLLRSLIGTGATGRGGSVDVAVRGRLTIVDEAGIWTETGAAADAGSIRVRAGALQLDRAGFIYSEAKGGGRAGAIDVATAGAIDLAGGASISTLAAGVSAGQGIRVQASALNLSGESYLLTSGADGAAPADIALAITGPLRLAGGANVTTATAGREDAGAIAVNAGSVAMDSGAYIGSLSLLGASGRAGRITLAASGDAALTSGASVFSRTVSTGDAGAVLVRAVNLLLDAADVSSNAVADSGAAASGRVDIALSGNLSLRNQSAVDTSTLTDGQAGAISVNARDVTIDSGSRVSSRALDGRGAAGSIDILASGRLVLRDEASLSTGTSTSGAAGKIRVVAESVLLESAARIDSTAGLDSSGPGGDVSVTATGALVLRQAASIGANTSGAGTAGSVVVNAGSVALDGLAAIASLGSFESSGNAGRIAVTTGGDLSLHNGAFIGSDAFGSGRAGSIDLRARNVTLDAAGRIASTGEAGRIDIAASGDLALLNSSGLANQAGQISTSTSSAGNGGAVVIRAANVLIDASGGGIVSFAREGSRGQAGSIDVVASGELRILQGGVSATTFGAGAAGSVQLRAARVEMAGASSGVGAAAVAGSGGQTGNVVVEASERITLVNGATVSIGNDAMVADAMPRQPTTLRLRAPEVALRNGAVVYAASTGNVAASGLIVEADRSLVLDGSAITTSANTGNGGPIRIAAGQAAVSLRRSVVTTSVFGLQGDGGDIDLSARTLVLDSGFIQANTAARDARGGLVRIDTGALVASANTLFLGGDTPLAFRNDLFGFNVIQAAAPTGVRGVVDLSSPVLDLTGSLRALRADVVDSGGLGRSLCQTSGGSSLALAGRGGLAPSARGLQRVEPVVPVVPATSASLSEVDATPSSASRPLAAGPSRPAPADFAAASRGCL